ncbi:MAG: SCP2 sterol-binding domain-containing protein [Gammaproteobacteria bacterium]|nr:SCP2 sterol-binding domain-containing protein [Gammaproteobacteria bacterium]
MAARSATFATHAEMDLSPPPLALLRGAATVLPRPILARLADAVVRGLGRTHPRLLANLAKLAPAVVHIVPTDLPYGFALEVGREPVRLCIVDEPPAQASAQVSGSVAVLLDLMEGRIDSDTLFFRRDLIISGNTEVVVGLRNVLDREEMRLTDELGALCGPLRPAARSVALACERVLQRLGARAAAMHRTLHPAAAQGPDVDAELARCREEIAALTARLAALEARQKRRDERAA